MAAPQRTTIQRWLEKSRALCAQDYSSRTVADGAHSVTGQPPDGYALSINKRRTTVTIDTDTEDTRDVEQEVVAAMVAKGETDGYKVALMMRDVKEGE